MIYRRKPEHVEAIQWTGKNYDEIKEFSENNIGSYNGCLFLRVDGIGGRLESNVVNETDYIVKGQNGNYRSMDKRAFEALYEPETMKRNKEI